MRAFFLASLFILCASAAHVPVLRADTLRIMPLGDSITTGNDNANQTPGGYRTTLFDLLSEAGYKFEFVGSMTDNPGPIASNAHEGHGGYTLEQIRGSFGPSLEANQPDVVLLLAGTNDVTWSLYLTPDLTPADIAGRLDHLLDDLYLHRPNAIVLVGTIPRAAPSEPEHVARSGEVSALFPAIIAAQLAAGHNAHLVDVRAILSQDDLADSLHPSPAGYAKLGQAWFDALTAVIPPPIVPVPVFGDLDGDGQCDLVDWSIFTAHWRLAVEPLRDGDLSGDGRVDLRDFALFKTAYVAAGGAASNLSPVPEPSTLALATLALAAAGLMVAGQRA